MTNPDSVKSPPEAEEHTKEIEIFVNSRSKHVTGKEISCCRSPETAGF